MFNSSFIYERLRKGVESVLSISDRLANRVFTSEFNPFYRSGTIAIALLIIATVTGTLLLFVYRIGAPYESLVVISNSPFLLQVIRSLHRYSSDAMLVAVLLHALRMFSQRKSWGPRILAWVSGVLLLLMVFVTGWTGFVLVWDRHAQKVGEALARIIDSTRVVADPLARAFSGAQPQPPSAFFFLILFIHVVVPLALVFGIWVHTSRMARATWFPQKNIYLGLTVLLLLVSLVHPAVLDPRADLLTINYSYYLNIFYNFWLPGSQKYAIEIFIALLVVFGFMAAMPIILRPNGYNKRAVSDLDQKKCNGCTQCVQDCPYEAITMTARTEGSLKLSAQVALVDPNLCVSCGLCSASCARMTIGPPGRKGSDQFELGKQIIDHFQLLGEDLSKQTVIISCVNQSFTARRLAGLAKKFEHVKVYPVACMGSLHMGTIGYLAYYFKSLILAACPERNCTNKDAYMLLHDRIKGSRLPGLPGRVDVSRVRLVSVGEGEEYKITELIDPPRSAINYKLPSFIKKSLPLLMGFTLLLIIAYLSAVTFKITPEANGVLRLSWRLAGQVVKTCHKQSAEELAHLPKHMQQPNLCERRFLDYQLRLIVAGKTILNQKVRPTGLRSDGPLYVNQEVPLPAGTHEIKLEFKPAESEAAEVVRIALNESFTLRPNRVHLITLSADQSAFYTKE